MADSDQQGKETRYVQHAGRSAPGERPCRAETPDALSWSDPVFRALVWQVVIVGLVVLIVAYLVNNTNRNLAARHIATGFAFLGRVAGIPIGESLLPYDPSVNTFGRALIIGILNTLKVSVVGIVLATILGTLIGIGRLSGNWLLARHHRVLRRDAARHPGAAATAVLVHAAARLAAAAPVVAHRQCGVPVQPRHQAAAAALGDCR